MSCRLQSMLPPVRPTHRSLTRCSCAACSARCTSRATRATFALAAPCYCHFTSPIRRYPDLVVHRVLKLQLAYEQLGGKDALVRTPRLIGKGRESLPRILPQICRACSDAERAADAASHATQKIKIAQYYEDRLGERYAGTVSWVSSMGLFVRLDLTQVEGLVSIKSLGNEWFEFDEDALTLTGADTGPVTSWGSA